MFETLKGSRFIDNELVKRRTSVSSESSIPESSKHLTLDTDACIKHVWWPYYRSRKTTQHDLLDIGPAHSMTPKKYDKARRECLSKFWSVLKLCLYLEGTLLTLQADHNAPKQIQNLTESLGRLARWRLPLSECNFDKVLQLSSKHQADDVFSCLQTTGEDQTHLDEDLPVFVIDKKKNGDQTVREMST